MTFHSTFGKLIRLQIIPASSSRSRPRPKRSLQVPSPIQEEDTVPTASKEGPNRTPEAASSHSFPAAAAFKDLVFGIVRDKIPLLGAVLAGKNWLSRVRFGWKLIENSTPLGFLPCIAGVGRTLAPPSKIVSAESWGVPLFSGRARRNQRSRDNLSGGHGARQPLGRALRVWRPGTREGTHHSTDLRSGGWNSPIGFSDQADSAKRNGKGVPYRRCVCWTRRGRECWERRSRGGGASCRKQWLRLRNSLAQLTPTIELNFFFEIMWWCFSRPGSASCQCKCCPRNSNSADSECIRWYQ